MKKLVVFIALILSAQTLFSQGIVFQNGTWSEMISKAKEQNKLIFVDFYTSWCAPCKVVAQTVFPDPKLGRLYNERFINYKIDAEKGEGVDIAKKYEVNNYPTFLYINGEGEVVSRIIGGKTIKEFIAEVENVEIYAKYGGTNKMDEEYTAGRNDSEFLSDYLQFASEEKKDEAYNRYLMSLPEEIFLDANKRLFDEIRIFDLPLYNRIADGIIKMDDQYKEEDAYLFFVRFAAQYKMTEFINQSIASNDRKQLDEILTVKKRLSVIPGSYDGDVNVMDGRGLFFASDEFINLIFSHKNDSIDKFKQAFKTYINGEMVRSSVDTLNIVRQNNMKELPREFHAMFSDNFGSGCDYFISEISSMIDLYWKNSPSDKATTNDCVRWLKYLNAINPYNNSATITVSTQLVKFNKKKDGIAIVKNCINLRKELKKDEDVKDLEDQLRYIENNKI